MKNLSYQRYDYCIVAKIGTILIQINCQLSEFDYN